MIAKLTVTVQAFVYAPKPAKQGKNFAAGFVATESDTGGPVTKGTVACTATVGTKHLVALTHAVKSGVVACVWHVPLKSKGKTLRGTYQHVIRVSSAIGRGRRRGEPLQT